MGKFKFFLLQKINQKLMIQKGHHFFDLPIIMLYQYKSRK